MLKHLSKFLVYPVICVIILSFAFNIQAQQKIKDNFTEIASISSISGHEKNLIDYIRANLPDNFETTTDNHGSLYAQIGSGEPELMFITSVDEYGYILSGIREDGYLTVTTLAGVSSPLFHQFHEGHFVDITTTNGVVPGVVSIPSSHITRGKTDLTNLDDFIIDIGARTKNEVLSSGVRILDPVTAVKEFASLAGNRFTGPGLGRKIAAFAMLETAKSISRNSNSSIMFVWATKGLRRNSGAVRAMKLHSPKKVILIRDFSPTLDRRTRTLVEPVSELNSGILFPGSTDQAVRNNAFYRQLVDLADNSGLKRTGSKTGRLNEANAFLGLDAEVVPVSIPVKYPLSLTEIIDFDDLNILIKFLKSAAGNY